jgi:TraM recognition site of TraD and TraG
MDSISFSTEKPITNTAEEKNLINQEVLRREAIRVSESIPHTREEVISDTLKEYKQIPSNQILHKNLDVGEDIHSIVNNLSPETHDKKIAELLKILNTKGIKNAIAVIEKLGDEHLEDDFHRFLIQYVKKGMVVKGLPPKAPISKALHMTLYEVVLPEADKEKNPERLKELVSGMEQFYAGMLSVSSEKNPSERHLALEIVNSNGSESVIFYAAVPNEKRDLFEKQIVSVFPNVHFSEASDDHNIFNEGGGSAGSVATSVGNPIFPIRTYDSFDHDPMNAVLQSFSKLAKDGEGACLQILISPAGDRYTKSYQKSLKQIENGVPVNEAAPTGIDVKGALFSIAKEIFSSSKKKDDKSEEKRPPSQAVIDAINDKISRPITNATIRLVASGASKERATAILSDLESSFNQFGNPQGNSLRFNRFKGGRLTKLYRNFAFRSYDYSESIPLNLKELSTLMHFQTGLIAGASQLKTTKSGDAPAPIDLPKEGTLLGINTYRAVDTKVFITDEDRLRHVYTVGQTGTGKTTLLKNMIIQDIEKGNGVCMIDPHGSDILDVLAHVPPERRKDVIYFDPSYAERPMGLNMLEYDHNRPEQKTFVVNELFSIFQKLYGGVPESMGPMFEQYFRNATMLVIEDPDTGCTLLDVSRVMSNKEFRQLKLSRCKNPIVVQFWKEIAEKAGGEGQLANIVPYITSKFDVFLANDIMRPIIAQEKSAFNFRDIMDNKKILLVNLSKGRLGDINANLIGLILVGKILMAALSRVDIVGTNFAPFYLYIDEFQNITTPSISTILSEARKYKLSLFIAHQFIAQLSDDIKNAVFGNVGNMVVYRVGADDAEYLAKQFEPVFTAPQIMNIDNFNALIKMLVHGKPSKPFNIKASAPPPPSGIDVEAVKSLSYLTYGRNRDEVQAEIMKKYENAHTPSAI